MTGVDSEFAFELRVCRWAEQHWHPNADVPVIVGRQLGTRRRRWDTVVVEVDPEAFAARHRFGSTRLDSDLLHVVRHAPESWAWYRDVLPDPGYPWRYVREAIHRAADRDIVETRKNGNRLELKRRWAYPDWVRRIVAIENKPDLDASAARVLAEQLEHDVAMALADEVWLATNTTDAAVEPALLEAIPVKAGIVSFDFEADDHRVLWQPRSLGVADPGTEIVERGEHGTYHDTAGRFEYVSPEEKAAKRLEIAERAYERGWRSYVDTMRPDCRYFEGRLEDGVLIPWCAAFERTQTARECAGSCDSFQPEPPAWRMQGWPIEGGPGKGLRRLLEQQRERARPSIDD